MLMRIVVLFEKTLSFIKNPDFEINIQKKKYYWLR